MNAPGADPRTSEYPIAPPRAAPAVRGDDPPVRIRLTHFLTVFVWAAGIAFFFYFFASFKLLLLGALAAAAFAAALRPLRDRIPGPRALGAVLAGLLPVLLLAGLTILISTLLAGRLQAEWQDWPRVQQRINTKLGDWGQRLGIDDPPTVASLLDQARGFVSGGAGGQQVLATTANVVSGVLVALVFVFFGSIYLLAERNDRLLGPVRRMLPPGRRTELQATVDELEPRLRWWLIGTLISMTVVAVLSWAGFAIVGLEFALPLALLVGSAEIVPTVGPAAAFVVVLLFAAAQGSGAVVGVIVVYVVVQGLESYVLLPIVMKRAVNVPPIVTLFTVVLWGKVFGMPGLLLAIPLDLLIWSAVDSFVIRRAAPPVEPA